MKKFLLNSSLALTMMGLHIFFNLMLMISPCDSYAFFSESNCFTIYIEFCLYIYTRIYEKK